MVKQVSGTSILRPSSSAPMSSSGSAGSFRALSYTFGHAGTFRIPDRSQLSKSYASPAAYAVTIALFTFFLCGAALLIMRGGAAFLSLISLFALGTILLTIAIFVLSLIASIFNCKIIGLPHSAKEHMIMMSSLTYLPFLILIHIVWLSVSFILSISLMILNMYYLPACYESQHSYADQRESVLHHVFLLVSYLLMVLLCVSVFLVGIPAK